MHPYILETEYAVRNLIELAVAEENTLRQERAELDKLAGVYQGQRWDFETSDLNDDFTEVYVMAAFGRMSKTQRAMQQVSAEVSKLEEAVAAHEASVQASNCLEVAFSET